MYKYVYILGFGKKHGFYVAWMDFEGDLWQSHLLLQHLLKNDVGSPAGHISTRCQAGPTERGKRCHGFMPHGVFHRFSTHFKPYELGESSKA